MPLSRQDTLEEYGRDINVKTLSLVFDDFLSMDKPKRCDWCLGSGLYIDYHDKEWGIPVHDDRKLFEMLCLEGAQAGLSWITILKKRKNYLKAFDNFNPKKVIKYDQAKIEILLQDAGIVRNKLKVNSVITNAKAFFKVKEEFGTFDKYNMVMGLWKAYKEQMEINEPDSGDY